MKTTAVSSFALLILLSACLIRVSAQSVHSCCGKPVTAEFVMLGTDASFKASHLAPLPFHFVPVKGKMISVKTPDGIGASGFQVKADKPTDNYLFVIHEWWGLNDYIKLEAEKLQGELVNVNVIALDLYDGKIANNPDSAAKFMGEAKESRIRNIINGFI